MFITAQIFDNYIDAHLLKCHLDSRGIETFLYDEHIVTLNPLYNIAVGGIKLKIRKEDEEKAMVLICDLEQLPVLTSKDERLKCHQCGNNQFHVNFKSIKGWKEALSLAIGFLFLSYPIFYRSRYLCKQCGEEIDNF